MRYRAYCYRIYPTAEQAALIDQTFSCARFAWNKLLENLHTPQTPAQLKKLFPWLSKVDSLALANAQMQLKTALNNFNAGRAAFPRFKKKRRERPSYTTNNVNNSIRLSAEHKHLRLPKLGLVKIKLHRPLPDKARLKGATVRKSLSGCYSVALLTELPAASEVMTAGAVLSAGVNNIQAFLPEKLIYPAGYQKSLARITTLKQKLSEQITGSGRQARTRLLLARLYDRAARQKNDYLHKLSRRIANGCGNVLADNGVLEENAALKRLLAYKLTQNGKRFIGALAGEGRPRGGQKKLSGVA
jgi:putative transposase